MASADRRYHCDTPYSVKNMMSYRILLRTAAFVLAAFVLLGFGQFVAGVRGGTPAGGSSISVPDFDQWVPAGDAVAVKDEIFKGEKSLRIARPADNLVDTSGLSKPFTIGPGDYNVAAAIQTDLYAQDMSFNAALAIRFLDSAAKPLRVFEIGAVQGKSAWKPISRECTAPAGTTQAQLVFGLSKTYGRAWLDQVTITSAQSSGVMPRRVKFTSKYITPMFYPEDRVRLTLQMQTPVRLIGDALKVQWDVRDYWNAPVGKAGTIILSELQQTADKQWSYQAAIDASELPLRVGPYYELHTQIKPVGFSAAEDSISFAILPESSATTANPAQLPFGTHSWDDRVEQYFALSARMGLRRCSIFWGWPATPPYTPDFKGWELECRMGYPKRYGLRPFAIVYPAYDIERGEYKHTDESIREGLRQTIEMYKKDGLWGFQIGNEPPAWKPGMIEKDVETYRAEYEAIKKADPSMVVIGSAIGPSEEFFKLGFQHYCDAMNIHGYGDLGEQRRGMKRYQELFARYGGKKPIYTTEIGSMSQGLTRHEIACDIVRKASAFFADGGEFFTWFAITYPDDSGERRNSYADSMDLFAGYLQQFNPRLDAIGYFHFIDLMSVKKFAQEVTYSSGATGMLFRDAQNNCLQVLWNISGEAADVTIPLADVHNVLATHIDGLATRLDAAGSGVTVRIGSEPVMLSYQQSGGALAAAFDKPLIHLQGADPQLIQGSTVPITFETRQADASIELTAPAMWPVQKTEAIADGVKRVTFNVAVPHDSPARAGRIKATLHRADGSTGGELLLTLPVESRIAASIVPLASTQDGKAGVRLVVKNNGADTQVAGWKLEVLSETPMIAGEFDQGKANSSTAYFSDVAAGTAALKPGEERNIDLELAGVKPLTIYNVRGQVTDAEGKTIAQERFMGGFVGVHKVAQPINIDGKIDEADWARATVMSINDAKQFFTYAPGGKWKGPQDLSGKVRALWDDQYLYLSAAVTDDVFSNPGSDGGVWSMDGLQMLIDPYRDRAEKLGRYDYYAGVGQKGPQVWRGLSADGRMPSGEAKEIKFAGQRANKTDGSMNYEMAIPWASIAPFEPASGRNLGIGLILNEDDGAGRTSFLGWFGGAHSKTVNQVGDLILLPN